MRMFQIRGFSAALLLVAASCSSEDKSAAKAPPAPPVQARGQVVLMSQPFVVEALDAASRMITLKSPSGKSSTFHAGEQVRRFNEIHVGDTVVAQYSVGVLAELREPTAEEKAAPKVVQESATRGPSSAPPAGAMTRTVRVVTTVDGVDREANTITLKGPQGNIMTAIVEDPSALSRISVGQHIVATFSEQLVVATEPGAKN